MRLQMYFLEYDIATFFLLFFHLFSTTLDTRLLDDKYLLVFASSPSLWLQFP